MKHLNTTQYKPTFHKTYKEIIPAPPCHYVTYIPDHNKLFSTASSNTVKNRLKKSSQQNAIQEKENFNNDTERKLSQGVSFTRNHQENSRYGLTTKPLVLIKVHLSHHKRTTRRCSG